MAEFTVSVPLGDWPRSTNVLVVGNRGAGKSALINRMIGKNVATEALDLLEEGTNSIQAYTYPDKGVRFWDSPGLQSGASRDIGYIHDIKERCSNADLMLYCIKMSNTRIQEEDQKTIVNLTEGLGKEIWEKTIFVLTFANDVVARLHRKHHHQHPGKPTVHEIFTGLLTRWKDTLVAKVKGAGVDVESAKCIPVVPAGYETGKLFDVDDSWIESLWHICAAVRRKELKLKESAQSANFSLSMISGNTMASLPNKVDILHPYASLKWRECRRLPVGVNNAQAVWLGDKQYVGGRLTSESDRDAARLYIYTPTTDTWNDIDTPVYWFTLITYHSQLVLVGGREYVQEWRGGPVTNKLWTLTEHDRWMETLPPMTTKRQWASAVEFTDYTLVAGGVDDKGRDIDTVEVYNGHHWAKAQCLPEPCCLMKSTLLNGHWYLMGGVRQGMEVYYASLDSLVASCQPCEKPLPFVWKRLPDVPNKLSSTALFGNRLIAVGGKDWSSSYSSSIHAYSPYTQSWIHVGDMPVGLGSTCTAVLPTGELMVIGGSVEWSGTSLWESSVYKASLNVTYDSDSYFTTKMISRLRQIGTESLAELEAHKRPLQSVVGMDKVDLPIDNSFSLLEMWEQGHASLRPTWRHFFWALREIKLNHLADQIETFLSGMIVELPATSNLDVSPGSEETEGREEDNKDDLVSAKEEKHIAAVQKAIKERGALDHTIVHGVFVGPARSGKNSLMERLLGRMPSSVSPSTGVAESVVQVKVMQQSVTFAANVEESIWSVMDSDDEAIKLMLINSESQNRVDIPILQTEELVDTVISEHSSQSLRIPTYNTDQDESQGEVVIDSESEDEWYEAQTSLADEQPQSSIQPCPQLPDSYVPPLEIIKIALRKKVRAGLEVLQQHIHKSWLLYLTNTGGQLEFQEVLPLLVSGPCMFIFTFRLDRDLNKSYAIEYDLAEGTSVKTYTSTLTTLEGMLQTLASISAMGMFVYQDPQKRNVALRPKVFIVGTHKDQLDSMKADNHIARVDHQLQEVLRSTSHRDLVEFASPTQLIFTVNNFSESDSDFQNIRLAFERAVIRDEFRIAVPSHWLIFSLTLRRLKADVISYDLCLEVARECGLSDDELDEALHFIDTKMGLIRYFPYEDVKNFVVIHPQYLFDKITELIVNTFTKQQMDDFKKKGFFSLADFEDINSKSATTASSIKAFPFLKLLEKLRIAAPLHMDGNVMYFLPCVLAHVPRGKITAAKVHVSPFEKFSRRSIMTSTTNAPPLIVSFECGYCPRGLPGALISYLTANEMLSSFVWKLHVDKIFRDQISFKVGPLDMVLDIYSTHLMISVLFKKSLKHELTFPPNLVCCEIREVIEVGIRQISSDMNYINAQHSLTFYCRCNSDHPAILEFVDGTPHNLLCSKTYKQFSLPKGHELWHLSKPTRKEVPSDQKQSAKHQKVVSKLEHVQSYRLCENHHSVLLKQLINSAPAWRKIGIHLGFTQGELNSIQANPFLFATLPVNWLSTMLTQWLQWAPGDSRGSTNFATLEDLKHALSQAGLEATAHNLKV